MLKEEWYCLQPLPVCVYVHVDYADVREETGAQIKDCCDVRMIRMIMKKLHSLWDVLWQSFHVHKYEHICAIIELTQSHSN